ncbi:hypothetical protein GW17_00018830 [Ensete ventricosum]|nr:hypothetical protein GW17_00018830 [Ensete ventricosum]RZR85670.1 hypothetical protein BHM03_00012701 [Ensete ventricosum]
METTITLDYLSGRLLHVQELVEGFDQETAAVVLARYVSLKMEMEVSTILHTHDQMFWKSLFTKTLLHLHYIQISQYYHSLCLTYGALNSFSGNLLLYQFWCPQAFSQLLQAPQDDAQMIIRDRFPVPRLVICDQHGSQVCFHLSDSLLDIARP